jgi:hypothetical protein
MTNSYVIGAATRSLAEYRAIKTGRASYQTFAAWQALQLLSADNGTAAAMHSMALLHCVVLLFSLRFLML